LFALEPLANRLQNRHLPIGPGDAADTLCCEGEILYVMSFRRGHVFLSVFGRGAV
jgi:hypothetical protein